MNSFFYPSFYVNRTSELAQISHGLLSNGIVSIVGDTGVGKSVLAKMFAKKNSNKYSKVAFYKAIQFKFSDSINVDTYLPNKELPILTIIDGLEELENESEAKRVLEQFV